MQPLGYAATNALQRYSHDGVDRLTRMFRGAVSDMNGQETWSRDATGNWNQYNVLDIDASEENFAQSRQANRANEITELSRLFGAQWLIPSCGPGRQHGIVSATARPSVEFYRDLRCLESISLTEEGESEPTATDGYDSLTRRITIGDITDVRHCYYIAGWQDIEERLNSESTAERQFTWGLRCLDAQICRDADAKRLYGLQDANWNLVAISAPPNREG